MKKVLIVLAVLAVTGIANANMLVNGGFEDGDLGNPQYVSLPGWEQWHWGGEFSGYHHNDVAIGTKAMKMWWDDCILVQTFDATVGTTYNFGAQVMNYSAMPGTWNAVVKAQFVDASWASLEEVVVGKFVTSAQPMDTWVQIGGSREAPANAVRGRIMLQLADWFPGVGGQIQFDEAFVTPEPATISMLGLGVLALLRRRK
jgi:hypothetical protein